MIKIIIAEDKPKASTEDQNARQSICDSCSFNDNGTCLSCNCVIARKILYEESVCPEGKW
jgi:hypothetical protein